MLLPGRSLNRFLFKIIIFFFGRKQKGFGIVLARHISVKTKLSLMRAAASFPRASALFIFLASFVSLREREEWRRGKGMETLGTADDHFAWASLLCQLPWVPPPPLMHHRKVNKGRRVFR